MLFRSGDAAVLLEQVEFDGAGVDADPDGDLMSLTGVGHEPDFVFPTDVAGVDTDLVDARLDGGEGEFIVDVPLFYIFNLFVFNCFPSVP